MSRKCKQMEQGLDHLIPESWNEADIGGAFLNFNLGEKPCGWGATTPWFPAREKTDWAAPYTKEMKHNSDQIKWENRKAPFACSFWKRYNQPRVERKVMHLLHSREETRELYRHSADTEESACLLKRFEYQTRGFEWWDLWSRDEEWWTHHSWFQSQALGHTHCFQTSPKKENSNTRPSPNYDALEPDDTWSHMYWEKYNFWRSDVCLPKD